MPTFKAIIVDDEWLVRSELKIMLAAYPEIAVVGEAANVAQAILINSRPEVIFTISMPGAIRV
jgi:DNA-binding NarL/FixJ family response regulator